MDWICAAWLVLGLFLGVLIGRSGRSDDGSEGLIPIATLDRWRARTEWREKRPK